MIPTNDASTAVEHPQDQQALAGFGQELLSGAYFANHARSAQSADSRKARSPMARASWAHCMETVAKMARRSYPLAQVAARIHVGLYHTPPQACASVWEAVYDALADGYHDVLLRAGPEAPRPSACHRDYTLAERIEIACWITEATAPLQDGAPAIGWALEAIARREGVDLQCLDSCRF